MAGNEVSKDLFLSILAMDVYNRGYNSGLSDGEGATDAEGNDIDGLGEAGKQIGNAIVKATELPTGSQDNSFYALAYDIGAGVEGIPDGAIVISYRGTDNFGLFTNDTDLWTGWAVGGGYLASHGRQPQKPLPRHPCHLCP